MAAASLTSSSTTSSKASFTRPLRPRAQPPLCGAARLLRDHRRPLSRPAMGGALRGRELCGRSRWEPWRPTSRSGAETSTRSPVAGRNRAFGMYQETTATYSDMATQGSAFCLTTFFCAEGIPPRPGRMPGEGGCWVRALTARARPRRRPGSGCRRC